MMDEKDWNSVEATYHLKQSERNALDVVALNKLEEIVCVAQLRQRVAELEKELSEVRRAERKRVEVMILNGRFLHDQAPTALFAKEVVAAIRAMGDE